MRIIYILLALLALCAVAAIMYAVYRSEELDEREDELSKYSVHLDERANKIAADEATLTREWRDLRDAAEELRRRK